MMAQYLLGGGATFSLAACLLKAGINGFYQSAGEWVAPNNYFVGLGGLFLGMGIVCLLMVRLESKEVRERGFRPINTEPSSAIDFANAEKLLN
jgi:hypothetical protein